MSERTCDRVQRLPHLLHYCKGKAREAIEAFVMLPPEVGYERTCETLKDLFGRPHEVSWSLLNGLCEGIKTSRQDSDALSD